MSDTDTETTDVKTLHKDTPTDDTDSANQGVGVSPLPSDGEQSEDDPKSGGTPVHKAPSEDSPQS
jgi:hypothetical protein